MYTSGVLEDGNEQLRKDLLVKLFWNIYAKSTKECTQDDILYVLLYGMRFLEMVGDGTESLVKEFATKNHTSIYTHPISAYLFMSAYKECKELREGYSFSNEIFLQCKKVFDYMLFSDEIETSLPFYFAELSYHEDAVDAHITQEAYKAIGKMFAQGYLRQNVSASGVAKCMEDFARRGETTLFNECLSFLESRKLSRFKEYLHSTQESFAEDTFTEDAHSQYFCLDTQAHLVHAYLNLYEKK